MHQQFCEILIPPAVLDELKIDTEFPGVEHLRLALEAGWSRHIELHHTNIARVLKRDLDDGEAKAIALALQLGLEVILIDEHEGRVPAKDLGLYPIGVLGVLLRAKHLGSLDSVGTAIHVLKKDTSFDIEDYLIQAVMKEAGEI